MDTSEFSNEKNRRFLVALCVLLGGTILLGVVHLSHSVWYDEGLTWRIIQGATQAEVVKNALTFKPMPPLYFLLTQRTWHWLGGEAGLRMISFLAGLCSIWLTFVLASRWAGRPAGIAAAAFMAATPGLFFYFVDANPYATLVLAVLLSLLLLERALEHNRIVDWLLYWLALVFGLSVHTLFILYAPAQWLIPPIRSLQRARNNPAVDPERAGVFSSSIFRFCIVLSAALLLWSLWVVFYFRNNGYRVPLSFDRLLAFDTLFCLAGMIPGFLTYGHWIQWVLLPVLLAAGVYRIWISNRERIIEWLLLWILPVLTIGFFIRLTLDFFAYRYGLGVLPLTALVVALGTGIGWQKRDAIPGARKIRFPLQILFAVYLLAGFGRLAFGGSELFTYQDWRQAVVYLHREAAPQDFIWFPSENASYPFRFYDPFRQFKNVIWPETRGQEQAWRSLEGAGRSARERKCRTWVLALEFQNASSWIDEKTRTSKSGAELIHVRTVAALPERTSYQLVPVQKLKRVGILLLDEKH